MNSLRTHITFLLAVCLSFSVWGTPIFDLSYPGERGLNVAFGAAGDEVDTKVKNPLKANSIEEIINSVINFIFTIGLIVCPLVIIAGGFIMITAGGEPDKVGTGRRMIYYALIGLGIIILAKGFVLALKQVLKVKDAGLMPLASASGTLFKKRAKR
jgi:hypothetical protein